MLERCFRSRESFLESMQRHPRELEARYLQVTFQRRGDLIYIPIFLLTPF